MLEIEHVHKISALESLVDEDHAGAVITNHFHLAPILAEEHEQIAIDKFKAHLLAHQ